MKKEKIIILYASVGGGHLKAAEGVKDYISKNYKNCSVKMIDSLKYTSKVVDKIVIRSYVNMVKFSPEIWGDIYKFSEKQYTAANFSNAVQKLLSNRLYTLIREEEPDSIISTHPFITEMVASLKKRGKIDTDLNVILTDYASHKFWELKPEFVNKYFVANKEMKEGLIYNGIPKEKIFVTGIPISPAFLEPHNKEKIYEDFGLDSSKKTILFFGGGEYGLSKIKDYFEKLLEVESDIQIVAVAGKNLKTQKTFRKLANTSSKKSIILGYSNRIHDLMSIADFVISKPGGLTTTEVLVSNIPFIIINPIPGQEEENARFLLNNGAAVRLYDKNKVTPFLNQLFNDDERIFHIKEMQKYIAKPNSTKDIVETILND